ncbi:ANTAR domain-containing response regulator [Megasphaera vaginalis (ex Bordigoni et al. 2020)]|uniref:ANTAR domain-containing response regulator n=1 Tax=Megasphaera vaginalis (ex Bordigoni et al. 2020) TaxID=2045301 RepID=UPI000C7DE732|nr:response regulator [Megasphaera vaginalis (ex Bordigoni et al. 2020)]
MGYRIVIADDETIIRLDLCEMLEEAGHQVVGAAADGVEALALVRRERPDLVFLDIKMPKLDGIHAAKMIAHEGLAPVLLLTAYDQHEVVDQAKDSGIFGYLVKPVTPRNLFPAMEVAVLQFRRQQEAVKAIIDLHEEIEERKLVERAKGLIMETYDITEDEAYRRMRQYSMKTGKALKEIAAALIAQWEKREGK